MGMRKHYTMYCCAIHGLRAVQYEPQCTVVGINWKQLDSDVNIQQLLCTQSVFMAFTMSVMVSRVIRHEQTILIQRF